MRPLTVRGAFVFLTRRAPAAGLALVFVVPGLTQAQRGRGVTGERPAVDIVHTVGCAERKQGSSDAWWLVQASEPRVASGRIFNSNEVEAATTAALGTDMFQLIGVADFLDTEGLLRSGQRKEFTTPETANATGALRPGRRILVKGLLISPATANEAKRLNVISLVGVADTCN